MRRGFDGKARLLLITAGWAPLVGCGRARSTDFAGGAPGMVETPRGGSGTSAPSAGGSGGMVETPRGGSGTSAPSAGGSGGSPEGGGAADVPPAPVDPEVSRSWTWQPCGTLQPEAADRAALFDASGRIVVLGPSGVRVHGATGVRDDLASGALADLLVTGPNGSVLSGRATETGLALTPVGESAPSIVLPHGPVGKCGSQFAFSTDGAYVLATGQDLGCAWRVSDSSFVGSVAGEQVTIRNSRFVIIERTPETRDVVLRDFAGSELSRRHLGYGSVVLSPAGDRAVVDSALVDLDTGSVVTWDVPPTWFRAPFFSPRGEMVLVGDGVFSAADGTRRFKLDPKGRLVRDGAVWTVLAPDGSRAVSSGYGRATVFDVEAKGVSAVLGPPVLPPDPTRDGGTSDLAISRDGTLLVHNLQGSAAYGIRLAPSFSDSQVIWDMRVGLNRSTDVSADGRLAAVGGDGRAIYDGRDGHEIWEALAPPAGVGLGPFCLLDQLRFSSKATWFASSDYSRKLQVFSLNGANSAEPWQPLLELPGSCDAPAFSRDERLMATSAAALYRTGASPSDWTQVWSSPLPVQKFDSGFYANDVNFSPDETQLLVSHCTPPPERRCDTTLLRIATGAVSRSVPELDGPHPSFSPEGSWIVAANKLLHLPSGEVRSLGAGADASSPALFTPGGDIIAGSANGALTRYCRSE